MLKPGEPYERPKEANPSTSSGQAFGPEGPQYDVLWRRAFAGEGARATKAQKLERRYTGLRSHPTPGRVSGLQPRRRGMRRSTCETAKFDCGSGLWPDAGRSGLWAEYVQPEQPEFDGKFHIKPEHANSSAHCRAGKDQPDRRAADRDTAGDPDEPEHRGHAGG